MFDFLKNKKSRNKIASSQKELESDIAMHRVREYRVKGKKICIARNSKGFYAFDDKCPHNGFSLSKGFCTEEAVVCPLHRYGFDLTTGRAKSGIGECVRVYNLEINEDGVYVYL